MKQILFFLFCSTFAFSQTETYRFSKDIISQIEKDTVAWKYQVGATELSFAGYYTETLKTWDKNGVRKPKITSEDSVFFANSEKINAKKYIIEQAQKAQITIINEAHHVARHRTFTTSLLQELYNRGYRYLGLEALSETHINQRKFATLEYGYYLKEPEFGNLVYTALQMGFTLFSYEASEGKNGKEREIEQAENIKKFIEKNPEGKILIHCGYAHAYENDYPAWGKAMAGRLKDLINTDPFTIDQTQILERADPVNNHLFMRLNTTEESIVLLGKNRVPYRGTNQTDVVVIHPETKFVNHRPDWLIKGKIKHEIRSSKTQPALILAYRDSEYHKGGIPADSIETTDTFSPKELYLAKGTYEIVIKDSNYKIVDRYTIHL